MKILIDELREEQSKFNPSELVGEIGYLAFEVAIRLAKKHEQQVKSVDLNGVSEKLWTIMADPSISKDTFDRLREVYDEICDPVSKGNYPVRIDINYV